MPARQRRIGGDVSTSNAERNAAAGIDGEIAGDQVEQRRLAGAIGPDDAERLARLQRERDLVGDPESAEALGDVIEGEDQYRPPPGDRADVAAPARSRRIK